MLKRIMIACVLGFISITAMEKEPILKNQQKTLFFVAPAAATPQLKDLLSDVTKDFSDRGIKVSWLTDVPTQRNADSRYVRAEFMTSRFSDKVALDKLSDAIVLIKDGGVTVLERQAESSNTRMMFCESKSNIRTGVTSLINQAECLDKLNSRLPNFIQNMAMAKDGDNELLKNKTIFIVSPAEAQTQLKNLLADLIKGLSEKGATVSWLTDVPAQKDPNSKYVRAEFMTSRFSDKVALDKLSDAIVLIKDDALTVQDRQSESSNPRMMFCESKSNIRTGLIVLINQSECLDKLIAKLV